MMNRAEIRNLANTLMFEYVSDQQWCFQFDERSTRVLGRCKYATKTITFSSKMMLALSDEEIEDTIRHEIAHILAGPGIGHGPEWQKCAIKVGARPTACAKVNVDKAYTWAIIYNGRIIKGYFRKPNQKTISRVPHMYLSGKPETKGQLKVVKLK